MSTDTKILGSLIVLLVGLFALLGYADYRQMQEWEAFKVAHKCKVVAEISSSTSIGIGSSSSGNVVVTPITTPGKTGWLCDDGVTYYR